MTRIAVIMTVHNRKRETLKCLSALFSQNGLDHDYILNIYLTDDGSTDGTADSVKANYPSVNIIEGNGNLYWNRGMYTAWKKAADSSDYDYYLWLNDDTFLYIDAIQRLLSTNKEVKNGYIIVGSTCASYDNKIITYGGFNNRKLVTELNHPRRCEEINGNIVLISRHAFNILGFNDYNFRHAAGDTDYGLRAKKAGIPCIIAKGVFGVCDLHDEIAYWKDSRHPFKQRLKHFLSPTGSNPFEFFYFRKKHYGLIPACLTFLSNWIHFLFPRFWNDNK